MHVHTVHHGVPFVSKLKKLQDTANSPLFTKCHRYLVNVIVIYKWHCYLVNVIGIMSLLFSKCHSYLVCYLVNVIVV